MLAGAGSAPQQAKASVSSSGVCYALSWRVLSRTSMSPLAAFAILSILVLEGLAGTLGREVSQASGRSNTRMSFS